MATGTIAISVRDGFYKMEKRRVCVVFLWIRELGARIRLVVFHGIGDVRYQKSDVRF